MQYRLIFFRFLSLLHHGIMLDKRNTSRSILRYDEFFLFKIKPEIKLCVQMLNNVIKHGSNEKLLILFIVNKL